MATKKGAKQEEEVADQSSIEVEDIFDEENVPKSNFFKFENVGDRISGELIAVKDAPAKGVFKPQRVFTLKVKDGSTWNVGIALDKTFVIDRLQTAQPGDKVGFEFKEEIPATTKGFNPAKSIMPYLVKAERDEFGEVLA